MYDQSIQYVNRSVDPKSSSRTGSPAEPVEPRRGCLLGQSKLIANEHDLGQYDTDITCQISMDAAGTYNRHRQCAMSRRGAWHDGKIIGSNLSLRAVGRVGVLFVRVGVFFVQFGV